MGWVGYMRLNAIQGSSGLFSLLFLSDSSSILWDTQVSCFVCFCQACRSLMLFVQTELFSLCVLIYSIGILYIIFVLQEVKVAPAPPPAIGDKSAVGGIENPAFVKETSQAVNTVAARAGDVVPEVVDRGFFREFFDPTLTLALIEVVFKKREGKLRLLLWLVLVCNIVFLASLGENDLIYLYTRLKVNWSGSDFVFYLTYSTFLALAGTLLMVGLFSKLLGISDPMIGIISTVFTLISKPFYVSIYDKARFAHHKVSFFLSPGFCHHVDDDLRWCHSRSVHLDKSHRHKEYRLEDHS